MLAKKLALPAHLALNQEQDMKLAPKLTLTSRENAQTINYAMLLIPIIGRKFFLILTGNDITNNNSGRGCGFMRNLGEATACPPHHVLGLCAIHNIQ